MKLLFAILISALTATAQSTATTIVTSVTTGSATYDLMTGDTVRAYVKLSTSLGGYDITMRMLGDFGSFTPTSIKSLVPGLYECVLTNNGSTFGPTCGNDLSVNKLYSIQVFIQRNGYDKLPVLQKTKSLSFQVNQVCDITATEELHVEENNKYFDFYGNPKTGDNEGFCRVVNKN
jgi:hypothetical protein